MKQDLYSDNEELTTNKSKVRTNSIFNRRKNILLKPIRKSRFLRRNSNNYKKPDTTNNLDDNS